MFKNKKIKAITIIGTLAIGISSCTAPKIVQKKEDKSVPEFFISGQDSTNSAKTKWQDFFKDEYLKALIDSALKNNQELNIVAQEIAISNNEVMAKKGEYLPFLNLRSAAEVEKVGRYTSQGANDANTEIKDGKEFPEPFGNFVIAPQFSWELDIWKKLRNSKKAASMRYYSSVEGKKYLTTQLVSEIAHTYYELMALDNQLEILKQNIAIQQNALKIVKMQKKAAKVTELAVKKFEAEVAKNQSQVYFIQQEIFQMENKINFLVGRYPQEVQRSSTNFIALNSFDVSEGVPAQLLENRPDIRQAEFELTAAKLDVKSAKANFYPSLGITANLGFEAFNPKYLLRSPESILYNTAGDLMAPLINKRAIKAEYYNANAKQTQAVFNYEKTVLMAFTEVLNLLNQMENIDKSFGYKEDQVEALTQSIKISNSLFKSARADYMEVLMTQRDALEAKMELIETKQQQINSQISLYKALGGGW